MKAYVCGAWTEQHQRARPMIARLREAGVDITMDWTQAEGDIGSGGDSQLSDADRVKYAQADLDGVLQADIVWLLAANDRGACGSWVELGAAQSARQLRVALGFGPSPIIFVSGPKNKRTIFTELADKLFETDEEALAYIVELNRGSP